MFIITGCEMRYFDAYYTEDLDETEFIPKADQDFVKIIESADLTELEKAYKDGYILLGKNVYNYSEISSWAPAPQYLIEKDAAKKKASLVIVVIENTGSGPYTWNFPGSAYTWGNFSGNGYSAFTTYTAPSSTTSIIKYYRQTHITWQKRNENNNKRFYF